LTSLLIDLTPKFIFKGLVWFYKHDKSHIFVIMEKEKLRLDKYLWAIRLFKTRSQAADACDKGKVKYKGENVKASKNISVSDEYEVKTETKKWVIKVTDLLYKRVQYSEAIKFYTDITPAEELDRIKFQAAVFHTGKRLSKQGRPTKKDKRELDEFMNL
jgi:ribosome-associated heat shock protein Hsp15